MNFFKTSDLLGRSGPFNNCVDYLVWYLVLSAFTVGLVWLLRWKKNPKLTKIALIVICGIAVFADVVKINVSVSTGEFVWSGSLPLYICSIFMYAMPFAIWGKGKIREMACTFVCTIGLFGAFMNYIIPSVTINHSLFSFWGLHTTIYHSMLLLGAVVILMTGYHKVRFRDYGWAFLGFVVLTFGVVIIDFIIPADYMYFRTGEGTSLGIVMSIASATKLFWPVLMYLGYAITQIVMTALIVGVDALVGLIRKVIMKNKAQKENQNQN
ncbi:MAG: YwaF family protein [Clostridia bacterium]|nr:YwaF family protein [Clostridia bacterium]